MFAWRNNKFWQRIYYHCIYVHKNFGVKKSNEKNFLEFFIPRFLPGITTS